MKQPAHYEPILGDPHMHRYPHVVSGPFSFSFCLPLIYLPALTAVSKFLSCLLLR